MPTKNYEVTSHQWTKICSADDCHYHLIHNKFCLPIEQKTEDHLWLMNRTEMSVLYLPCCCYKRKIDKLIAKLRFQDKWIKEANFLENWTGAVRWNPNKGECLQAKQTASKGFINSSRQPLTHYYWKPWISSRQVIGLKRNI